MGDILKKLYIGFDMFGLESQELNDAIEAQRSNGSFYGLWLPDVRSQDFYFSSFLFRSVSSVKMKDLEALSERFVCTSR